MIKSFPSSPIFIISYANLSLVEFFKDTARLRGNEIGDIDILDKFSFFDISKEGADKIFKFSEGKRFCGRRVNLEVAKRENDVIFLDDKDRERFASYDPTSPESLIALRIQQSKYLESSLIFGGYVEENFVKKDKSIKDAHVTD